MGGHSPVRRSNAIGLLYREIQFHFHKISIFQGIINSDFPDY